LRFDREFAESSGTTFCSTHIDEMVQHVFAIGGMLLSVYDTLTSPFAERSEGVGDEEGENLLCDGVIEPEHLAPEIAHVGHKIEPLENNLH
jgi:hypothetical protein